MRNTPKELTPDNRLSLTAQTSASPPPYPLPTIMARSVVPLLTISARAWTLAPCLGMLALMVCTYALYFAQGRAGLPTISDTFVHVPGNYASRVVVGLSALALYPVVFMIDNLVARVPPPPPPPPSPSPSTAPSAGKQQLSGIFPCSARLVLQFLALAVFGLSWVGAICDSRRQTSCEGNSALHTVAAALFFGLMDAVAAYVTVVSPRRPHTAVGQSSATTWPQLLARGALAVSLLAKARFAPRALEALGAVLGLGGGGGGGIPQWVGSALEIADALSIMVWVPAFLLVGGEARYLSVAVVVDPPQRLPLPPPAAAAAAADSAQLLGRPTLRRFLPPPPVALALRLTAAALARLALALQAGTVAACLAASLLAGAVAWPPGPLPYLGNLFVAIPANWLARWGLVAAAGAMLAAHVALFFALRAAGGGGGAAAAGGAGRLLSSRLGAGLTTACGTAAALGLAVAGAANEVEGEPLHALGAAAYTLGGGANALLLAASAVAAAGARRRQQQQQCGSGSASSGGCGGDGGCFGGCGALLLAAATALACKLRWVLLAAPGSASATALGGSIGPALQWLDAAATASALYLYATAHADAAAPGLALAVVSTGCAPLPPSAGNAGGGEERGYGYAMVPLGSSTSGAPGVAAMGRGVEMLLAAEDGEA